MKKKTFPLLVLSAMLFACGSSSSSETGGTSTATSDSVVTTAAPTTTATTTSPTTATTAAPSFAPVEFMIMPESNTTMTDDEILIFGLSYLYEEFAATSSTIATTYKQGTYNETTSVIGKKYTNNIVDMLGTGSFGETGEQVTYNIHNQIFADETNIYSIHDEENAEYNSLEVTPITDLTEYDETLDDYINLGDGAHTHTLLYFYYLGFLEENSVKYSYVEGENGVDTFYLSIAFQQEDNISEEYFGVRYDAVVTIDDQAITEAKYYSTSFNDGVVYAEQTEIYTFTYLENHGEYTGTLLNPSDYGEINSGGNTGEEDGYPVEYCMFDGTWDYAEGWTYLDALEGAQPAFYNSDGGLKVSKVGQGVLSPAFAPESYIEVWFYILALNTNQQTGTATQFTITGLDTTGAVVDQAVVTELIVSDAEGNMQTYGILEGEGIVQVKVELSGNAGYNVSLGGVYIYNYA